ncbi:GNAT family N-acetyltransferase [Streptomyces sp. SID13666]|uniref:GNAT family N-acetyltransferase n=1 Tax=unclassified Streptomyces TaxID=2593676 RepID=UPI0013C0A41A|nr:MULTISPECIES: GNAT family N-acetyltransferase [unclassified Streptomyces]NEA54137.1 GNAT family N-acetyltransferase [Streptomyces sp. SID13666]NEA70234.1 GNAT family N-acetyltransferase [Streptomyces sp. SID13588]
MDLLPFDRTHAVMVAGWPLTPAEVSMWCGLREFPLPACTVEAWQQADDVRAHLLVDGERPIGYGELWIDAEEQEIELARIIVAPDARGNGHGRTLVRELLAQALLTGHTAVFLRVHPDNDRALRCYRAAGFAPVHPRLAESWNAVQPVAYVWLRYDDATP